MSTYAQPACDEGVIGATRGAVPCAPNRRKWVLAATILGSSMAFIDGTAISVALPVLQSDLGASVSQLQWVVEAYALLLAALLLTGGALGDRLGRRRVFTWGIAIFTAGSVWGGLAPDATQLIIARAVQGAGGALLVPGSLAIIGAAFSDDDRARAVGTWSGATAMTAALGPVLGGWLVGISWRWVFFMNIPIAAAVVLLLYLYVDESKDETAKGGIDWAGGALAAVGLGLVVFALIESGNLGLSDPLVYGSAVAGIIALALFAWVETKVESPTMPLGLFRSKRFTGANLLTLFLYGALGGALFYFPFNLIQVQGYSPAAAGAAWLPFILTVGLLSRWAGGLMTRFGARLPLTVGPAITAVGFAMFAIAGIGSNYWMTFFPASLVLGIGMAVSVAPLVTVVMSSVGDEHSGVASGVNNAVSRTASLIALAVIGLVVLSSFNGALDERLDDLGAPVAIVAALEDERVNLAGLEVPEAAGPALTASIERAVDESFVFGFRVAMLVGAAMAAAAALAGGLLIGREPEPQAALAEATG